MRALQIDDQTEEEDAADNTDEEGYCGADEDDFEPDGDIENKWD